ncbi:MAG: hypoxanthine phosphoribosyltransferase [Rikenellaceae bacterium]
MKQKIKIKDLTFEIMIPETKIDAAVSAVAQKINEDYNEVETPLFLGVLNGSFMFMSDLVKKIEFNSELSFVKIASYEGTQSSGAVKSLIGLNGSIEGRNVVIVEDIVDSGNSIEHMMELLKPMKPASVKVCTLFFKPNAYKKEIPIDYVAMEIGNEFIVGYGLDYDQLGRTLKDIYVVCNE